jgi:hypothetical protein
MVVGESRLCFITVLEVGRLSQSGDGYHEPNREGDYILGGYASLTEKFALRIPHFLSHNVSELQQKNYLAR